MARPGRRLSTLPHRPSCRLLLWPCLTPCSHCLDYRQLHYHAWLAESCGRDVSRLPNWRAVVLHGMLLLRWLWVAVQRIRRRAAREPYGPA